MNRFKSIFLCAVAALCTVPAMPCSRVVFRGDSTDIVMVGRTLDWTSPIPTDIYVYPAGMKKQSMDQGPRFTWTSKYGSTLAVGYDGGVTEGMNDQGLAMNGLFCNVSEYTVAPQGSDMPVMSLSVLVSYFLDNFRTVTEVRSWLEENPFGITGATFDGGTVSLLHWAVTDRSGNTLIMEYDKGKLNLYEGKEYQTLTNNPMFPQMLAVNDYWKTVGGENFLPGSVRSSDRFVRGNYFIHHIPAVDVTADQTVANVIGVLGAVAVPYQYEVDGTPRMSTQWRSVSDLNRNRYYFRFSDALGVFYIDMAKLDLRPGAPVLKLNTKYHNEFFGNVNKLLKHSKPFNPMW